MNAQRDDEINEEDNPSLNAFYYKQTVLETEQQAIRDCCPESARFWKVVSSDKTNAIGQPTGYKIVPGPKVLDVLSLHPMTHAVTRALIYLASTQPYYPYQDTLRNTHSHPSPPPLIRNTPLPRALDTSICTLGARSEPQTRGVFRPSTVGHTLLCNGKISRYPSMETRCRPILSTHPLDAFYQHILSTHLLNTFINPPPTRPINTRGDFPNQNPASSHLTNPSHQPTLSTHPLNQYNQPTSQPTLSTHYINTGGDFPNQNTPSSHYQPTLSTNIINRPSQHSIDAPLTHPINTGGDFPNQNTSVDGLPRWTRAVTIPHTTSPHLMPVQPHLIPPKSHLIPTTTSPDLTSISPYATTPPLYASTTTTYSTTISPTLTNPTQPQSHISPCLNTSLPYPNTAITLPYPTLPYSNITLPYPTVYRTGALWTLPYPTLPYPAATLTLPYPALPYPILPYPTLL